MRPALVLVTLPNGAQAHLRRDTCEALGIRPREVIGQRLFDLARMEDFQRNKADRRREA